MNINLANILAIALMAMAEYKKGRDAVIAAGDPTDPATGAVRTDEELIALLKADVADTTAHIDTLLAKHGIPPDGQ